MIKTHTSNQISAIHGERGKIKPLSRSMLSGADPTLDLLRNYELSAK